MDALLALLNAKGSASGASVSKIESRSRIARRSRPRAARFPRRAGHTSAAPARCALIHGLQKPSDKVQHQVYIRLETMFTVSASTVALKKKEIAPCRVVSRRIVLLVI